MEFYQDIPRICTAIAEWGACVAYLYLLKKEKMKSVSFWLVSSLVLAVQIVFLVATANVPIIFWNPCMAAAAHNMPPCALSSVPGLMFTTSKAIPRL